MIVHAATELFGSKAAVYRPFLIPGGSQTRVRDPCNQIEYLRATERAEGSLLSGALVGIRVIETGGAIRQQDQSSVQESLISEIPVDPLAKVPAISNIAGRWVDCGRRG